MNHNIWVALGALGVVLWLAGLRFCEAEVLVFYFC